MKNENQKIKVGDVLVETKHNLQLKYIGLNEDKTRAKFVDESNRTYSMSKENLIERVKEGRVITQKNDWNDSASDFCRTVLKMGSRENLFDRYMSIHKIPEFELADFMTVVANKILTY